MREHDEDLVVSEIQDKIITIISNGDDFSYMIEYMLGAMGAQVNIIENIGQNIDIIKSDLVVLGPGYGDINNTDDPKMNNLLHLAQKLQDENKSVLGICLGHQALCKNKGLTISHQAKPTQGVQKKINFFGKPQRFGFYNSFSPEGNIDDFGETILDPDNKVIYQKTGNTVSSQFHPESVMSENGFEILKNMVLEVI